MVRSGWRAVPQDSGRRIVVRRGNVSTKWTGVLRSHDTGSTRARRSRPGVFSERSASPTEKEVLFVFKRFPSVTEWLPLGGEHGENPLSDQTGAGFRYGIRSGEGA